MIAAKTWPPQLQERTTQYLEQHAMGWFLLEWKTPRACAAANAAEGACPESEQPGVDVTVGARGWAGFATIAWPLLMPGQTAGCAAADSAASDLMLVALPQGTATSWVHDESAALAAAAQQGQLAVTVQFKNPGGHSWGRGIGRRSGNSSSGAQAGGGSSSSAGSGRERRGWFETPYASAFQYNRHGVTEHVYFMATSWAALWPVFLRAAVQRSSILSEQAKAGLTQQLNSRWQEYQRRLAGRNFPQGDGQQLLPPAAVLDACSAEPGAAGGAGQQARGGGSGSNSCAGAGSGLYPYLHSIYFFTDAGKRVPRSPYDLARDKRLWLEGAYGSLEQALEEVHVDDKKAAVAAIQNVSERARAAVYLRD